MRSAGRNERAEARLAGDIARLGPLTSAELRSEWTVTSRVPAPNVGTALLRRLLAQHIQEKRLGGLPAMVVRELERAAAGPVAVTVPTRITVSPGARLIREWQGRTIAVLTTDTGFIWEEREYKSLSQIALEVTGAHWSGPRFFGLTGRG
ncbi:MAG TPA: DUF2924 domain-containing protein [Novosphingobium sp.]|nr:DUF2924 domain-containing protein [Novosphingobium sp.]